MAHRTFVIGDVHGDFDALESVVGQFPALDREDTLVFLGDYVDRGPRSAQVVELVRRGLPKRTPAKIVTLRGNHEDAWLRITHGGWIEFSIPPGNGCLATLRSFTGSKLQGEISDDEFKLLHTGGFLHQEIVLWMGTLPYWYEDEHAIYVHAGIPRIDGRFPHPRDVPQQSALLWVRERAFFTSYRGKKVVCGHTGTKTLPPELSTYTPEVTTDAWMNHDVIALDTGAGKADGYLTAYELPAGRIYESPHPAHL